MPLPVAATTMPSMPSSTRRSTTRPSTPVALVTISTRGQVDGSSGNAARSSTGSLFGGGSRSTSIRPSTTRPTTPSAPDENASSRCGCALRTLRAAWISPAKTTTTDEGAPLAATAMASARLLGPSASRADAGRIAPVMTTGLVAATTRDRKKAVSSSVSVPCVTTMPTTSARARCRVTAVASRNQTENSMSLLSICATCSDSTTTLPFVGSVATRTSTPTCAET